jgi:hypothetical protein
MITLRLYPKSKKKIGAVGRLGPDGTSGMTLPTIENGKPGKRWFSWEQIEALGLTRVLVSEICVRVTV